MFHKTLSKKTLNEFENEFEEMMKKYYKNTKINSNATYANEIEWSPSLASSCTLNEIYLEIFKCFM